MELEFEGSAEQQMGIIKSTLRQHHSLLFGNGQQGIVDFVSATRGQYRLLVVLLTLVLSAVVAMAALEANRQWNHGMLRNSPITAPKTTGENTLAHKNTQETADTLLPYKEGYTR